MLNSVVRSGNTKRASQFPFGILQPIHEVLGRRHLERIAADGRAGMWRWAQPDDLGSERNRTVVSVPGDVLQTDED